MSKTLARQIRRIGKQKLWQPVPDSMAVELVPVVLSRQEYADKERAIRTAWRDRRKANR